MFAEAVATAAEHTRPVMVSKRLENQEVTCSMGTFVVVKDSGWILTAAHILQDMLLAQQHMQERDQYQKAVDAINANTNFSTGKKKHEINQLKRNWQWIVNCSAWWAVDGLQYRTARIDLVADLAIAQLTGPIETLGVKKFPTFADPTNKILQGTSLCRYDFHFTTSRRSLIRQRGSFPFPTYRH